MEERYVISRLDTLNNEVEVLSVPYSNITEAQEMLNKLLEGVEKSKKQKLKCSMCPLYDLTKDEIEAVKDASLFCKDFDFNQDDFGCYNEDDGTESTRIYRLHTVYM
jgi:septation ring formation regulator EzrA